jgi:hypothetical protein
VRDNSNLCHLLFYLRDLREYIFYLARERASNLTLPRKKSTFHLSFPPSCQNLRPLTHHPPTNNQASACSVRDGKPTGYAFSLIFSNRITIFSNRCF